MQRLVLMLLASLFLASCGLGGGEFGLQSIEADERLGRETSKMIEGQIGLVKATKQARYVGAIATRLLKPLDRRFKYQIAIMDMPEPNAFALPGGYIYVSRGLLALSDDETELAGAIAHEIVHVRRRHSAKSLPKATLAGVLQLPGNVARSVLHEDFGAGFGHPVRRWSEGYVASHGRAHEHEADQYGQAIMASAGYDPKGLTQFLTRLGSFESKVQGGKKRAPSYRDTHPVTSDRVAATKTRAASIEWKAVSPIAKNKAEYFAMLEGLPVGANPTKGVVRKTAFLHPDLKLYLEFPPKWKVVNTPSTVFGVSPDENGVLILKLEGVGKDPKAIAMQFANKMQQQFKIAPTKSGPAAKLKKPSWVLSYWDRSAPDPVFIHFAWIAHRNHIYRITGIGKTQHQVALRSAGLSFRDLTRTEQMSIKQSLLRIVEAKKGETLASLSARTGNAWDLATTALMNGVAATTKLAAGQPVKIAVEQSYHSP